MKIAIYSNDGETSSRIASELSKEIEKAKDLEIDELNPEIVISVGGDGTLLSAFHHYDDLTDKIRFVGIHTGHLGFYTDWRDTEVTQLVESLKRDNGQSVSYPLLDIEVDYADGGLPDYMIALNEATFKKLFGTMVAKVYIKGELFENFRGDGLCISTPTGSTAYNKSVGGAIISPKFNSIQVAEMASINNRVFRTIGSPIIIPPTESITIVPEVSLHNILTYDQLLIKDRPIKSIKFKISKRRIYFAKYRHTHFWQRVSNSFIGDTLNDD
ncbi:NAD kinase [Fructilactobacillus fructivorans]|uniref:NAD kinase n=1 Tax=Fructilactobacillus fructivorans TaxID=1614 RepID=UPI00070556C1|nr:NAD kinase [Fructilactobacillus fructivorans]KRN39549.1 inorganic polyphosphate ATP-NAD kinase [Fructilactobacillus fructivorans]KRN43268.1 inorganic polyphosphate ATP-NAD kinase [Fructilactobacillus fructivorans]